MMPEFIEFCVETTASIGPEGDTATIDEPMRAPSHDEDSLEKSNLTHVASCPGKFSSVLRTDASHKNRSQQYP